MGSTLSGKNAVEHKVLPEEWVGILKEIVLEGVVVMMEEVLDSICK